MSRGEGASSAYNDSALKASEEKENQNNYEHHKSLQPPFPSYRVSLTTLTAATLIFSLLDSYGPQNPSCGARQ